MTSTTLNRTKKSRRICALVAAGVATVFLAACGPSSSSDTPLPAGTESTDPYTPSYESDRPLHPVLRVDRPLHHALRVDRSGAPMNRHRRRRRIPARFPATRYAPTRRSRCHHQTSAHGRRRQILDHDRNKHSPARAPHAPTGDWPGVLVPADADNYLLDVAQALGSPANGTAVGPFAVMVPTARPTATPLACPR